MRQYDVNDLLRYNFDISKIQELMGSKLRELWHYWNEYLENESVLKTVPVGMRVFGFFILLSQLVRGYYLYGSIHSNFALSLLYIGKTGDVKSKFFESLVAFYAYVRHRVDFHELSHIKSIVDKDFIFVTNIPTLKQITGGNEIVTVYDSKRRAYVQKKQWREGALERKSFSIFEEFGQVLSGVRSDSLNILMQLNNAMDKPGYVDAHGISNLGEDGKSHRIQVSSSILMGSTLYKNFYRLDLLNSGFYRRPLFFCNIDRDNDSNIAKQSKDYSMRFPHISKSTMDDYYKMLESFMVGFRNLFYSSEYVKVIEFDSISLQKLSEQYYRSFHRVIESRSLSDIRLNFFLNSLKTNTLQILPIASLCASIDGRSHCTDNDFLIAFELCTLSLSSNLKFTESLEFTRRLSAESSIRKHEIQFIRRIFQEHAHEKHPYKHGVLCMSRESLLNELRKAKLRGDWEYGYNSSLKIIADLLREGHLQSTKKDGINLPHNKKLIYIEEK